MLSLTFLLRRIIIVTGDDMDKFEIAHKLLRRAALEGRKPGLERVRILADKLGSPQEKLRVIHISGTNGKGSFGAMLTSVLTAAGIKNGWFSSPALTDITDSFRICGEPVTYHKLAEVLCDIAPVFDSMDDKPTEFEVITAAAYELFYRSGCEIAVIECGLGGSLDSTNIVSSPLLSVITNVQLDHTDVLGTSTAEIAAHKAGIIKRGRPVLFGGTDESALEVIEEKAAQCGSELFTTDYSRLKIVSQTIDGTVISFGGYGRIVLSMLGEYQPYNAASVLTAVDILKGLGTDIPDRAVIEGMASAVWHGRFEVLKKNPHIIYDGAHNPDGIKSTARSIRRYFGGRKIVLLMCVMADKDYSCYADELGELAELVVTASPEGISRALDSRSLAAALAAGGMNAVPFDDFGEGVRYAVGYARKLGCPLAALGTLYMYPHFVNELKNGQITNKMGDERWR